MKIGLISRKDAEWLGMSASVAGGWIMCDETGGELACRFDQWGQTMLAAVPDHFATVQVKPIAPHLLLSELDVIIKRDHERNWCVKTKQADVERSTAWATRIADAAAK